MQDIENFVRDVLKFRGLHTTCRKYRHEHNRHQPS